MPDSLTVKTDPQYLEYAVPVHWERMSMAELQQFVLEMQSEATKDDADAMLAMAGPSMDLASSASAAGSTPVGNVK
eukprot:2547919-Pyramimonas_sp.AAC.1